MSEDSNDGGLFASISPFSSSDDSSLLDTLEDSDSKFGEYVTLLKEITEDNQTQNAQDGGRDFIIRPSAPESVREAYKKVRREASTTEEIPFENPRAVVLESERQLCDMRNALVAEVERIEETEEGSVTGADVDTMLYMVDKNAGKTGKFTILGGGESLIYNIGKKNNWHPLETKLILYAHEFACEKNNLERHLILDSAVIIPNDPEIIDEGEEELDA